MRRLNQENLVKLHECHETQNSLYFVLDLVKGGELLGRLKTKQLNAVDLQILMYNLMKALAHIHSKKCMHRDLKPENLLLKDKDKDHDIVVADFGLAAFLNDDIIFKRCGTPGFVAPEILLYKDGEPIYDSKCDVFSAGVIFYMLLTGK
jgi:serine/threonine protein kinase